MSAAAGVKAARRAMQTMSNSHECLVIDKVIDNAADEAVNWKKGLHHGCCASWPQSCCGIVCGVFTTVQTAVMLWHDV